MTLSFRHDTALYKCELRYSNWKQANLKGVKLGREWCDDVSKIIPKHFWHFYGSHLRTWF